MYPRASLEKAVLKTFDKKSPSLSVTFKFNPTEISVERGCGFDQGQGDKNSFKDFAGIQYAGAKVDSISMSFILDTTEPDLLNPAVALGMMAPIMQASAMAAMAPAATVMAPLLGGLVNDDSVTTVLGVITQMTRISDDLKKKTKGGPTPHPRLLQFTWGEKIKFSGGIESFSYKLTLFDSDGLPKRAEVDLKMIGIFGEYDKEAEDLLYGEAESKATSTQNI